ncbi:MAG: hypothetical protein GC151_04465 [Betaproteobacteria bacterium]|nr:hypothetical protein [Betaproteobacteria bacterium]
MNLVLSAMSAGVAAALLAAVALVVLGIYLLRPPPQRIRVASSLVWERVLASTQGARQRWRWWLSLLLALLIALALALALTDPGTGGGKDSAREVVLVVDDSATMTAWCTDGRTRFEHAVSLAKDRVRGSAWGTRFVVADTMRTTGAGHFVDRDRALRALDALAPVIGGHPRFPALALLPPSDGSREFVFISDGVAPFTIPEHVEKLSVFEQAANVGITSFSVRAQPTDATRYEAFVGLGNAATASVAATVTISGAGHDAVVREVQVPARGFASVVVPVGDFGGGALRASVEAPGDALDVDNTAFAFLPFNRHLRVALVTAGNAPLERALALDPRVRLTVLRPGDYGSRSGFDAYVFDRFAPRLPPPAPALLFAPPHEKWLPDAARVVDAPVVDAWRTGEPLLENVSLADVQIEHAAPFVRTGASVNVLARARDGRALVVASDRAPRWVAAAFSTSDSNFASQASFPVFLANAMGWLTAEVPPRNESVGLLEVPFEHARVEALNAGTIRTHDVPGATLFPVSAPDFVTVETTGSRLRVLVNVLDPATTDVNATSMPGAVRATGTSAAETGVSPTRWWEGLLVLAFVLLVAEWLAYHRRVTV